MPELKSLIEVWYADGDNSNAEKGIQPELKQPEKGKEYVEQQQKRIGQSEQCKKPCLFGTDAGRQVSTRQKYRSDDVKGKYETSEKADQNYVLILTGLE